jgi:3-oxoacyl-[acyl-carrier-protein] synthase II
MASEDAPQRDAPQRVVVTGLGLATSLGLELQPAWDAIVNGRSGVRYLEQFDSRRFPVRIGAEIDTSGFPPDPFDEPLLGANRTLRFAAWAAGRAWADAGLDGQAFDRSRAGVCVGAGVFPVMEDRLSRLSGLRAEDSVSGWLLALFRDRPELISQQELSSVSTLLSRRFDLRGPSLTVQAACTSGTQAIGEAFEMVRDGRLDLVLTGGADSMLSMFCVAGFILLGALSTHPDPAAASRPFDATRNGFVMGEGAAMLLLERLPQALARGAPIYAEVIGYGASSDGYRFTDVHPEGEGASRAMRLALASAGLQPTDVDYINAHGTATPQNDRAETIAIKRVFGDHARRLPVSSTKSHLGHLICAAGAIELLVTAMALHTATIPPTINLHRRDPECDLDYVPLEARASSARVALSNSFGFGGQNGTLALRRWDG